MASFFITKYALKNKEARFRAVITHGGKNLKSKTFRRKSEARTWANNYVLGLEQQEASGEKPCDVTFSQLCNEYLNAWTGKDHDRARMVLVWEAIFRDTLLNEVTPEVIRLQLKPKRKQAAATYNKHLGQLSSLFKFAIECHHDEDNPNSYVSKNPMDEIQAMRVDNKIVRFLSDEEKPRLISACKEVGGKFYLAFFMSLCSGMRKSEVMNLRWDQIDFDRGLAKLATTKNGEAKHSPLPGVVMEELKKYREIGTGLIFPSDRHPEKPANYTREWKRALKAAGIENFRWHDLRHDCASTMAMNGATLLEIGAVLGHRSPSSTSRYAHLSTDHKAKVLNNVMDKALGGQL